MVWPDLITFVQGKTFSVHCFTMHPVTKLIQTVQVIQINRKIYKLITENKKLNAKHVRTVNVRERYYTRNL